LVTHRDVVPRSLVRASWEIRPRDGSAPIRGDLRAPRDVPPESAVVICHGFKGFRRWGFFPALARALANRGHAAFTFDFSHNGVGADGVDFSALELFAEATHSRNVDEIRMVLDAVTNGPLFPRPPRRIGMIGHSRGGGEAVIAVAEDTRVDALVTWSAISAVQRWTEAQIAAWEKGDTVYIENSRTKQSMPIGPGYWADVKANAARLDVRQAAGRVRVPWLIIHGDADETVPVEEASILHEAAGSNAELLVVEGTGHTFGASHPLGESPPALDRVIEATVDWFAKFVQVADPVL
jgi:alpha-beta hydrolase superfamily lysophospholipase